MLARRGLRNRVAPDRPYAFLLEEEPDLNNRMAPIATIFLTNKECPFRCVMCDLWQNTLEETIAPGQIPRQIDYALSALPAPKQIKLYNSGSFFDPAAIPVEDYKAVAERVRHVDRIIVESHPAFLGERTLRFRNLCSGQLEVAIGLETAHEPTLKLLNKGMSLKQFEHAANFLKDENIALRVFLLIQPPFLTHSLSSEWLKKSVQFAVDHEATVVSLIPTRAGNGAMEQLHSTGEFTPPLLEAIEDSFDWALGLRRSRIFADLWDLQRFSHCPDCFQQRRTRLEQMNRAQVILPRIECRCGAGTR